MTVDMSGLVRPLTLEPGDEPGEVKAGSYDIWLEFDRYQVYFWSVVCGDPHPTIEDAIAFVDQHHASRVLATLNTALIEELVGALEQIESDAATHQQFYDRNGPQWTSPQGNEYEDTSSFLSVCNAIADIARATLAKLKGTPNAG